MEKNIFNIKSLKKNWFFKKSKRLISFKKYRVKNSWKIKPLYFMSYKIGKHIEIKYWTYIYSPTNSFILNFRITYWFDYEHYKELEWYPYLLNHTNLDPSISIDRHNAEEVLNKFYWPTIIIDSDFVRQNSTITFF